MSSLPAMCPPKRNGQGFASDSRRPTPGCDVARQTQVVFVENTPQSDHGGGRTDTAGIATRHRG